MGRLLRFKNGYPYEISNFAPAPEKTDYSQLQWIAYTKDENIMKKLPPFVVRTRRFTEDLLEEQRPRYQIYPSMEGDGQYYRVIILKFVTNLIFEQDDFEFQISILIVDRTIITISNFENPYVADIMSKIKLRNEEMNREKILGIILDELVENSIDVIERLEDDLENMEKRQLRWEISKNWLAKITDLKGRVYEATRSTRADIEVMRDLQKDVELRTPSLEHTEDRFLFLLDLIEFQRDNMNNIVNLHLSILSQKRAEAMDRLTIIGSLLVIPTIIAGLFGMNVPLPPLDFYQILWLNLILMAITALFIRIFIPKV